MSTKNGETTVRRESFLSNAWSNLRPARPPAVRTPGNDEYFSIGRQSNAALIEQRQDEGLFSLVRGNDTLEELLDIPYALAHIKDLHAAMQLAVVSMGEEREDLIASSLFFPVFGAFALGFSIGLVTAHRARHAATYQGLETLPKEDQQQCRKWGVMVAVYYITKVEVMGILDKETDKQIYRIDDHWRLLADDRRLQQFSRLPACVSTAAELGSAWSDDESVDVGKALTTLMVEFSQHYAEKSFH